MKQNASLHYPGSPYHVQVFSLPPEQTTGEAILNLISLNLHPYISSFTPQVTLFPLIYHSRGLSRGHTHMVSVNMASNYIHTARGNTHTLTTNNSATDCTRGKLELLLAPHNASLYLNSCLKTTLSPFSMLDLVAGSLYSLLEAKSMSNKRYKVDLFASYSSWTNRKGTKPTFFTWFQKQ